MKISRRNLLGTGAAVAVGAVGLPRLSRADVIKNAKPAKNIIFCVVDGMAIQTLTMVNHFKQLTEGKSSYWATLLDREDVTNGYQDTRSLSSVVTDSSAASSTWGCGRRIWNGQVNMYPDGTALKTLTQIMSENGVRCGLVTTATVTHATPAGFAVNCMSRDQEGVIAERYLTAGVDILMGGGDRFFNPELRTDKKDLYAEFQKKGFKLVKNKAETLGLKSNKILGLYSPSHVPFTVDHVNSPELLQSVPTLAEMTKVAIDNLKNSPKGFLLQVEGAKVDHGAHANDLAATLYDQMAFEDALKVVMDFAEQDGETLVIITADHSTGGLSLNGAGHEYFDSTAGLKSLANMKASYAPLLAAIGKTPSEANVKDAVKDKLGFELKDVEAAAIVGALKNESPFKASIFYGSTNATMGVIFGNHSKVTWTSNNHSNDHVIVTSYGPGSELCAGLTNNITFFDMMLASKGLKHSNPTMSFEEAQKHYEKWRASGGGEDEHVELAEDEPEEHRFF